MAARHSTFFVRDRQVQMPGALPSAAYQGNDFERPLDHAPRRFVGESEIGSGERANAGDDGAGTQFFFLDKASQFAFQVLTGMESEGVVLAGGAFRPGAGEGAKQKKQRKK